MNPVTVLSILALASAPAADCTVFQSDNECLAFITPLDSGILAVPCGYDSILYFQREYTPRSIPWAWDESNCISSPCSRGDSAAAGVSRDGSDYVLLFTPDSVLQVYGPYENSGKPVFDSLGNLWFTGNGFLYKNSVSTGIELDSHTISVDSSGLRVVFCDSSDRICIMNTTDGEVTILASGYRFYNPSFLSCQGKTTIISPTLEGEIVKVSPDNGTCTSLAEGVYPFWWTEREVLLYSVTTDDGYRTTGGEIWLVTLDGMSRRITFTPGINEIHPIALDGLVYAIEANTGSLITVPD